MRVKSTSRQFIIIRLKSMSTVTVTDTTQAALKIPAAPSALSALAKYAKNPELNLILLPAFVDELNKPLSGAAAAPLSATVNVKECFDFGAAEPQLSIGAGANCAIHVNAKAGSALPADDLYRSQVTVPPEKAYFSLAFTGSVSEKGSLAAGNFTAGFEAGAEATFEFFRAFDLDQTVSAALADVLSNYVIPGDVDDLKQLRPGDVVTCSGNRHIKASATLSASVSAVPLASASLPLVEQPAQVNASAEIDVSANFQLSAACQIRAQALADGIIELGVYKQRGRDWDLSVSASAGIDASLGSRDFLAKFVEKMSPDPEADQKRLASAGLDPDEIKAINDAIQNSVDHSIHASVSFDLSESASDEAAFLYRINLAQLTASGAAAVTSALGGDFSTLENLAGDAAAGITRVRSILTRTQKNGVTFTANLIGLLNYESIAKFISKAEAIHDPSSGDLFLKETATGERIGILTTPQAQEKLRKIIFDSILMTTSYRAGGAAGVEMECSQVHFAMNSSTNEHTMSDYLDWFVALGVLSQADKNSMMAGFHGTGSSTCTARVRFDDAACKALFLNANGPRPSSDYVRIARQALSTLLLPGDANDNDKYRRDVLQNDSIWNRFRGQTTIGPVIEEIFGWRLDDRRISTLEGDYSMIVWWADAMASTGKKVAETQDYLKNANRATISTDKTFAAKAADLQKHVMDVIKKSPMRFDVPFGMVALQRAAGGNSIAPASGRLISAAIHKEFGAAAATPA